MSDLPQDEFTEEYYNHKYFADKKGKAFKTANDKIEHWGYKNPSGKWEGAKPIAEAWKTMFKPQNLLDVGAGRGQFILAARQAGIKAKGFDFSEYAVGEGRVEGCKAEWLRLHDATEPWPYEDDSYDLVVALDFYEHIYQSDLEFVIDEMFRVAKKWIFLQIAVAGSGGLQGAQGNGYILKKGEPIPEGLEGCAVAGHVVVKPSSFWEERLDREYTFIRRDMVNWFYSLVPDAVVTNWKQNLVLVLELL